MGKIYSFSMKKVFNETLELAPFFFNLFINDNIKYSKNLTNTQLSNLSKIFVHGRSELYFSKFLEENHPALIKKYKGIIDLSNSRTSKSLQIISNAYIVFKTLHEQNINFIPLKGLQLIYFYKKNLAYRSIRDIDLLVKEEDIARTVSVLEDIGFYFKSKRTLKMNKKFSKNITT